VNEGGKVSHLNLPKSLLILVKGKKEIQKTNHFQSARAVEKTNYHAQETWRIEGVTETQRLLPLVEKGQYQGGLKKKKRIRKREKKNRNPAEYNRDSEVRGRKKKKPQNSGMGEGAVVRSDVER